MQREDHLLFRPSSKICAPTSARHYVVAHRNRDVPLVGSSNKLFEKAVADHVVADDDELPGSGHGHLSSQVGGYDSIV